MKRALLRTNAFIRAAKKILRKKPNFNAQIQAALQQLETYDSHSSNSASKIVWVGDWLPVLVSNS